MHGKPETQKIETHHGHILFPKLLSQLLLSQSLDPSYVPMSSDAVS